MLSVSWHKVKGDLYSNADWINIQICIKQTPREYQEKRDSSI